MSSNKSLAGVKIVVTRPRAQARDFIRRLRRHGARVSAAPAIRIAPPISWRPLDEAMRALRSFDAVIFTSANGVERFLRRARRILGQPPKPPRLFAIGPATAKKLASFGWRSVEIPDAFEGGSLARLVIRKMRGVREKRILIARARAARDVLPRTLKKYGARTRVVAAYRTLADRGGLKKLRAVMRRRDVDFVAFTSSSTAERFIRALGARRARAALREARPVSIGPVTSSTLRRHGIRNILQARRYTTEGLIRAIVKARRSAS